jgi:glutamine phosphoribosylpyrophosphate amidotransferase
MCGIAGFCLTKNETGSHAKTLAGDLLLGIEHRGPDATGLVWRTTRGDAYVQKDDKTARDFVDHIDIPRRNRLALLHTRWATTGSTTNPDNNHPIQAGHIVGTHNGKCHNHTSLFSRMGVNDRRIGQVDSEAIFAAIAWGTETNPATGKPRLARTVEDALGEIDGVAALAWVNLNEGPRTWHLARLTGRPLWFGRTEAGSVLYASIPEAIVDASLSLTRLVELHEVTKFTHLTFSGTRLAEVTTIPEKKAKWSSGSVIGSGTGSMLARAGL